MFAIALGWVETRMRWISFTILLYVAAALQTTHLLALSTRDYPAIEYLPLLAIFYALFAAEDVAPLCGLWCGVAYDLISTGQPLGTAAVPLALMTFIVVQIRSAVFREHFIAHMIVAVLGIMLFAFFSGLLRAALAGPDVARSAMFWSVFFPLLINALYSGCIAAPLLFWPLRRLGPALGLDTPRGRKY